MSNTLFINPKDDEVENVSNPLIDLRHREKQLEDEIFNEEMERYFQKREIKTHFPPCNSNGLNKTVKSIGKKNMLQPKI